MKISSSVTPLDSASSRPATSALYSATLLVATPMPSATSPITSPDASARTTPMPAGPGFPRAPPSVCRVPFMRKRSDDDEDAAAVVAALETTFGAEPLGFFGRELGMTPLARSGFESRGPHAALLLAQLVVHGQ